MYRLVMAIRPEALPTDPSALTEMVLALDAENEKLRVAMQTLKEMIFGKRSERLAVLVDEQLALELGDLDTDATLPVQANDDAPAASFRTYVEKVLLPVLRPGDIVILDNLGSHRSKAVRQLIRSVGAKLFFLPKYSPDLNPIEQVFAKLKHLLRKAATRTVDAVCAAIGHALDAFTSVECANYLKNSGYRT